MQIFPAATRQEIIWKNGLGITHLVASAPGRSWEFGWRLSLADVSAPGPFSSFPGIFRLMGILQGKLKLDVEGLPSAELKVGGPAFAFPGDANTYATPLDGPVQDINLMFDPSCFAATLEYAPQGIELPSRDAIRLIVALNSLTLNDVELAPLDAALVSDHTTLSAKGGALWVASLRALPY